jgi:cell division protein FtsL
MNRLSPFVWMVVIVVAAFMLYKVKYQVQALKVQVAETAHELEQEKQAMHVVAAEWAYLNRPDRLQKLATKYLGTSEMTVGQIAQVGAIPFPGQNLASIDNEEGIKPVSARMHAEGRGLR